MSILFKTFTHPAPACSRDLFLQQGRPCLRPCYRFYSRTESRTESRTGRPGHRARAARCGFAAPAPAKHDIRNPGTSENSTSLTARPHSSSAPFQVQPYYRPGLPESRRQRTFTREGANSMLQIRVSCVKRGYPFYLCGRSQCSRRKSTGNVYRTLTTWFRCFPGLHRGDCFSTRTASSASDRSGDCNT